MLTPDFKLTQSDTQITIVLRLPYVKISSCEFYIQSYSFKFYLKPYLLSLTFQQPLKQVQQPAKAIYYHDKHLLQVCLDKQNSGEHFDNLNLLANLMSKNKNKDKDKNSKRVLVQVIGEQASIKQNTQQTQTKQTNNKYSYGFCHNYAKVFANLQQQCYEIFSFNPQQVAIIDRFELSQKIAQSMFDQDAYLFDKYDNQQQINQVLHSKQTYSTVKAMMDKFSSKQPQSYQQMKNKYKLANKQILLKGNEGKNIAKQLLSISFSYLYELQCMQGQLSVQSAKTINNTSAILSCCVDYQQQNYKAVLVDCAKRCAIYSLYKNVMISNKVIKNLYKIFTVQFLCAMLSNLKVMFDKSQPRYLLNTIYIDDYLIYCLKGKIQTFLSQVLQNIKDIQIREQQLNLNIQQNEDQQQQQQQQQIKQKQQQKVLKKQQLKQIEQLVQNNSFKKKAVLIQEIQTQNCHRLEQKNNDKKQ